MGQAGQAHNVIWVFFWYTLDVADVEELLMSESLWRSRRMSGLVRTEEAKIGE